MSLFKCKMCGGSLDVPAGSSVIECEYCGTQQTLPKLDDEKRANLYDRANHFRRNNEFDKAMAIYEQILNEDKTDAEAYWSIVLCRYGIEYVEDPSSHRRIPTVNRAQFTSILADEDYKSALDNADTYQKSIYELEAKAIDEIQKGILAISSKEEPFDVFICYKETDNGGRRTPDSVLAQDLYYGLKNEGFKVFFARITLEDKLGSAYEPYIFAALNSAKVMVVLGTKPEFFNAVWVKNEWSRYLALIKQGQKKMLIPAYKDMDPYDLPEEFSHLQAQDMSKLGFMQDLIRGIKKIAGKEKKEPVKETVIVNQINQDHDTAPILKRAFLFLEDGDFESADEYSEKVLDIDPECSDAYIVKLLIDLKLRSASRISSYATPIDRNPNYVKALRFAKGDARAKIDGYNQAIVDRIELDNKKQQYANACSLMSARKYDESIAAFSKISTFKDSVDKIEACKQNKESDRKEGIYAAALRDVASTSADDKAIKKSISALESIKGYKDVDAWIEKLQARLEKWYEDKKAADERARIKAEQDKLEAARQAELRKIKAEQNKKKAIKAVKIGIPSLVALVLVVVLTVTLFIPMLRFNKADKLFAEGKYEEANSIYRELDGFGDSDQRISTVKAIGQIEGKKLEDGIKTLLAAGVPVELTYQTEGGSLTETQTLMAGYTLSLDNSVVPLSAETLATTSEQNVFTFTQSADFTGLKTPGRNGYRFLEWVLSTYAYDVEAKDAKFCLILKATWSTKDYVVEYDLAGGSLSSSNVAEYDPEDAAFTLINPTRVGYTFAGWTGTGLPGPTIEVTVPTGSYGNREYTATWTANEYTVTYDAAGGTVSSETQKVYYDSDVEYLIPERAGYNFLGWYENATKHENEKWTRTSDLTLVAKWDILTYEIKYELGGGANHSDNPASYKVDSDTITLNDPSRTGYIFTGWTYEGQDTPTKSVTIAKGTTGEKTYTANWQAITSTITFDPNGGTCDTLTLPVTYDSNFTLPTPQWDGHTFSGWYNGGTKITSGICNLYLDTTLIAQWDAIEYTITYTMNGGTNSSSNPKTYTCYDQVTLKEPTRTGYTFLGWTYSGQTTPTKNVTIFAGTMGDKAYNANWKVNTYTVTFDANSGTVSHTSKDVTFDTYVTLLTPTRTGYTFSGWYNGGKQYTSGVWKTDDNITLTATWMANTYKATYNANGGSVSPTYKNYTYDAQYTLLTPQRTGYEFISWYNGDSIVAQSGTWKFDTDISLKAEWKAITYTVTYDAGIGTSSVASAQATYDSYFTLATAERVGYTFDGWYYNGSEYSDGIWKTAKSITLTAKWVANTDTKYVVNHYQQNITDDEYTLESTQNLAGTSDASVTPSVKTYTGFTSPATQTVTIKPDGTRVVDYYYTRNYYTITLITNGGTGNTVTQKYQSTLNPNTWTIREDYTFGGWFTDAKLTTAYTLTKMPAKNATIYAYWAEENKPTDFTYSGTSSITVSAYNGSKKKMVIPAYIGGKPVVSIGKNAFSGKTTILSVIMPDTITTVGEWAFYNCSSMISLQLSENLQTISDSMCYKCTSLTEINIPDSVTAIDGDGFRECTSLKKVRLGKGITDIYYGAFFIYTNSVSEVHITDLEAFCKINYRHGGFIGSTPISSGAKLYVNGELLTDLVIPESITEVDDRFGFSGYTALKSITFHDKVTSIGSDTFDNCSNLEIINLGNGVTSIGTRAFSNCSKLSTITGGENLERIDFAAFHKCTGLTSFVIGEKMAYIGVNAFYGCSNMTSVTFEDPSVWYVSSDTKTQQLTEDNLRDSSTAAKYIRSSYVGYTWEKE